MNGVVAILLMGGSGTRFGSDLPKQFHRLSGKKIYQHTLERFLASNQFEEILLVTHQDWIKEVEKDIQCYPEAAIRIIAAGKTRQESSYRGLQACRSNTQTVVIHDAVRPFINEEILKNNITYALTYDAVNTCIPSIDTLVYSPSGKTIESIPNRASYFRGQTPQSFNYSLILKAHQHTTLNNASDDCSLILEMGRPVHITEGDEKNIKITTELDLFLADQLLRIEKLSLISKQRSLSGKRFVITGGTGGIGSALVFLLQKEDAIPLVISRSSKDYPFDLSTFENVQQAFSRLHKEHGPIDGLINCIGLLKVKQMEILTPSEIDEILQINLLSPIYCSKCAFIKDGGHLVNVSSSSYTRGRKDYVLYSSAKAALVNFTQGLAEERPALNINVLVPGRTDTKMRRENFPEENQDTLLSPEEVAKTIVNILKQDTLTGSTIETRANI